MSYSALTRWGDTIDKPNDAEMDRLLDSLVMDDDQNPDVSLTHESGWTLSVFDGGLVVWQNRDTGDDPVHMTNLSRQQVLSLWHNLARGETESLQAHAWQEGPEPDD